MAANPSRYERTRCYRRGWAFERVGWIAMAATTLGAVGGVFGDGWLSAARTAPGDGFAAVYPRFCRAHAPFELTVEWSAAQADTVLWISRAYVDELDIQAIRPMPEVVEVGPDRFYYTFRAHDAGARVAATFTLLPKQPGALRGGLGVANGPELEARQWVFP